MRARFLCLVLLAGLLLAAGAAAGAAPASTNVSVHAAAAAPRPVHGWGHRLLFYLPNRLLDLADMFRFRLRVGPGLSADVRATIYAANFIGQHDTVYVGLPGPRRAPELPRLSGREALKGLMVMGVDATDATPHPPRYSDSEVTLGVQAGVAGLDLGLDPVELGDFLAGWLMFDVMGDDL